MACSRKLGVSLPDEGAVSVIFDDSIVRTPPRRSSGTWPRSRLP